MNQPTDLTLIAGLGNPGYEYAFTPHNLGFMVIDRLAEIGGVRVERPEAQAMIAPAQMEGHAVLLAKPQTYMNLSGQPVKRLLERYQIPVERLIVLVDDLDLPFGALRIRPQGSAGSHNGLKSIIGALGSGSFSRVRMGIQPDHPLHDRADYVLAPFRKSALETVAEMVDRAAEAVGVIVAQGVAPAMNRYNPRNLQPES